MAPENFTEIVRALAKAGFAGANVTIPHKQAAFEVCDAVDPFAARAGAVNTLIFGPTGITGLNTDGPGFIANLVAHGVNPAAGPALILGAGGAARAIGAALQDAGAEITLCNRSADGASTLATQLNARTLPWDSRGAALANFALLVNTTSLGMAGQPPLELDLSAAPKTLAVADIVYAPLETPLLAAARTHGLRAIEGLGMLLHQAVPGFAAWFGVIPVVDAELYSIVSAP